MTTYKTIEEIKTAVENVLASEGCEFINDVYIRVNSTYTIVSLGEMMVRCTNITFDEDYMNIWNGISEIAFIPLRALIKN